MSGYKAPASLADPEIFPLKDLGDGITVGDFDDAQTTGDTLFRGAEYITCGRVDDRRTRFDDDQILSFDETPVGAAVDIDEVAVDARDQRNPLRAGNLLDEPFDSIVYRLSGGLPSSTP